MADFLAEKSGKAKEHREMARVPRDDDALVPWARKRGFGSPKVGETFRDYRARLQGQFERQLLASNGSGAGGGLRP
jgi:hypothetical protein